MNYSKNGEWTRRHRLILLKSAGTTRHLLLLSLVPPLVVWKNSFSTSKKPDIGENCTGWSLPVTEVNSTPSVSLPGLMERHQQLEDIFSGRVTHISASVRVLGTVTPILTLPRIASVIPRAFPWYRQSVIFFWPLAVGVLHVEKRQLVRVPEITFPQQLLQVGRQEFRVRVPFGAQNVILSFWGTKEQFKYTVIPYPVA